MKKILLIASDHAGYDLKKNNNHFSKINMILMILGQTLKNSVDYPDFAHKLSMNVSL